jgi:hypothetical protein
MSITYISNSALSKELNMSRWIHAIDIIQLLKAGLMIPKSIQQMSSKCSTGICAKIYQENIISVHTYTLHESQINVFSSFRRIPDDYFKLNHYHVLLYPFQFITHFHQFFECHIR